MFVLVGQPGSQGKGQGHNADVTWMSLTQEIFILNGNTVTDIVQKL